MCTFLGIEDHPVGAAECDSQDATLEHTKRYYLQGG